MVSISTSPLLVEDHWNQIVLVGGSPAIVGPAGSATTPVLSKGTIEPESPASGWAEAKSVCALPVFTAKPSKNSSTNARKPDLPGKFCNPGLVNVFIFSFAM